MEIEKSEVKEQIRFIGDLAEKKIASGQEVFLDEQSRVLLRGMIESGGVDLSGIEGKAVLSDQATAVYGKLGGERTQELMREVVLKIIELPGGGIYGKGNPVPENSREEVGGFVDWYIKRLPEIGFAFDPGKYEGDGTPGSDWKKNTVYRMEAIFTTINKLMWIMGGETPEEGVRRQGTEGVGKHLRERVMRGHEKAGDKVEASKRYEEGKIIRHLPKGSMGVILEGLVK